MSWHVDCTVIDDNLFGSYMENTMANKASERENSSWKVLTFLWLAISAAIFQPAYSMLVSMGLNEAFSVVMVLVGICLMYDIPYRAKVKAQHQASMSRAEQWRGRHC